MYPKISFKLYSFLEHLKLLFNIIFLIIKNYWYRDHWCSWRAYKNIWFIRKLLCWSSRKWFIKSLSSFFIISCNFWCKKCCCIVIILNIIKNLILSYTYWFCFNFLDFSDFIQCIIENCCFTTIINLMKIIVPLFPFYKCTKCWKLLGLLVCIFLYNLLMLCVNFVKLHEPFEVMMFTGSFFFPFFFCAFQEETAFS